MEALCSALLCEPGVKRARVFSVFSVDKVTEAFAQTWEELTGIKRVEEPYYDAIFSVCTASTLVRQQRAARPSENVVLEPRLAVEQDAEQIAKQCEDFAATSPPFFLTDDKAREEARILIANKQVWVLEMKKPNEKPEIATIVAVTRKSEGVATITKVYTPAKWRGNGCAERLVRHVCIELLEKYQQIVLYVGVENCAKVVYDRVGFQGLSEGSVSERWVETGFDRKKVELGHW
jgi:predicted GNAT family acetyltransferase